MIDQHHGWNASFKPLYIGFVISLLLTVAVFEIIRNDHLSNGILYLTVFGSAIFQAIIQLVFFLFVGMESKPLWNTISFVFVVLVLVIVIGGSVWIMSNLSYNLKPPTKQGYVDVAN